MSKFSDMSRLPGKPLGKIADNLSEISRDESVDGDAGGDDVPNSS